VLIAVPAALLADPDNGLPPLDGDGGPTRFNYQVASFDRDGDSVDQTPVLSYDTARAGLNPQEGNLEPFVYNDLPGIDISVKYDTDNFLQNGSLGLLLLHMHNGDGNRSEVVSLQKPVINRFQPLRGGPGTRVTISGAYFNAGTVVRFANNVIAIAKVLNSTTLIATVPGGVVSGPITVSNPLGSSASAANFSTPGRAPVVPPLVPPPSGLRQSPPEP